MAYFIGVDVGSGSVRVAVTDKKGNIIATSTENIKIWNPKDGFYEQSSTDIWNAVVKTIKSAVQQSGVSKDNVAGIGFDATCSLVVLDKQFKPLTISPTDSCKRYTVSNVQENMNQSRDTGQNECNIVMWMDHRAVDQASFINRTNHQVLQYVGGKMSLEMQPPKLLWLKQMLNDSCWKKAGYFFDLPDFLTWKATGSLSRSQCSVVCKWGFLATTESHGWSESFLKCVGLEDLMENNFSKIGFEVKVPGEPCKNGLSAETATELGLLPATPVSTSIIDAHAGVLGCLGCEPTNLTDLSSEVTGRLVLICGTSSCHMVLSSKPVSVPGVWGPYNSVIIPGYWLNEGGQSATGKLIDFIVESHSAYKEADEKARTGGMHIHDYLNEVLKNMAASKGKTTISELTEDFHVYPDYHGNRSPLADPTLKGMVSGLTLQANVEKLALLYLATVQALAYGTRHILDTMGKNGHTVSAVFLCGGLRNNSLFVKTNADVIGLPVILPDTVESVLLGSAILGACASGHFSTIEKAMREMGGKGVAVNPDSTLERFHNKKYRVFLKMLEDQKEYQNIMAASQ